MIKKLLIVLVLFCSMVGYSQIRKQPIQLENRFLDDERSDTTYVQAREIKIKLSDSTYITDYKVIDYKLDTTLIDTTLSLKKDYKFNYLRKDNLELMAFANQGQTFNPLAYTFNNYSIYPKIGASAKHYNFYEIEDIKYYYVPTPTTELMYRTGMEQGQVLDAMFTFNLSKQFNASIAFKGMRSLGKYRNTLSDHGSARVTMSYFTKNKKYFIRAHLVSQDVINDENGGLTEESIFNFESGNSEFKDRNRLVTNFTDAKNILRGNRYYFEHFYKLWTKKDSTKTIPSELKIGHVFNYERKHYEYEQDAANPMFGFAFSSRIDDDVKYSKLFNEVFVSLNSPLILGELKVKANHFNYVYQYKSILIGDGQIIDSNLSGNAIALEGEWLTKFKKLNLNVNASTIIAGDLTGYNLFASASFVKTDLFQLNANVFRNSKSPNFNFLLFQSDYKKYNWQNNFKNIETTGIGFVFNSKKWLNANIYINNINNYTYFNEPEPLDQTKPVQTNNTINYLKIKLDKEFKFGHFALDNQVIYQNVTNGSDILRVPDFITRNTIYYSNYLFKGKPLFLQTGVTFSYFSKYLMNSYNPVISEFYLQNDREFGGFPMFDFFLNIRIRTMRVFFKLEHFNSGIGSNNFYSAPTYPYRDFSLRFGVVWNFFI